MEEGYLYNWIFHYNHHMDRWFAFNRDDYRKYFNEFPPHALKSTNIETLISIINEAKGDKNKIQELINGGDIH
jgi:hypothetical protein